MSRVSRSVLRKRTAAMIPASEKARAREFSITRKMPAVTTGRMIRLCTSDGS